MAATLDGVQFWETDGGKIKLLGFIRGMESGKRYSLKFLRHPVDGLVHSDGREFTYISGDSFSNWSLAAHNAYIPTAGDGAYTIVLEEVGVNCEQFIEWLDSASIDTETHDQDAYWATYRVRENGSGVGGISIIVRNNDSSEEHTVVTGANGMAQEKLPTGNYQAHIVLQPGYTTAKQSIAFAHNRDQLMTFDVTKVDLSCAFVVRCQDEKGNGLMGSLVTAIDRYGNAKRGVSGFDGKAVIYPITCGQTYSVSATKSGYDDSITKRPVAEGRKEFVLTLYAEGASPGIPSDCPNVQAEFSFNPPGTELTAENGERYTAFKVGTTVDFVGATPGAVSEIWEVPGDRFRSSGNTVTHQFGNEGRFSVMYVAKNSCGQSGSKSQLVVITDKDGNVASPDYPHVEDPLPDQIDVSDQTRVTIGAPCVVIAGDTQVSGTAPNGAPVNIVVKTSLLGLDYLAKDEVVGHAVADAFGRYNTVIKLDEFGVVELQAVVKKDLWGVDVLAADIKSSTEKVIVLTWLILASLVAAVGMIAERRYKLFSKLVRRG